MITKLREVDAGPFVWIDSGMMIHEDKWPAARRIALGLGVGVVPPETAFGIGIPFPEIVRNDFLIGDWKGVFDKAVKALRTPNSHDEYEDILEAMRLERVSTELSRDGHADKGELLFPSAEEWSRIQKCRSIVEEQAQLARCIQESHLRLIDDARGISLPSGEEWLRLQQQLSRSEQIKYLSERIQLARGTLNLNDVIVPTSIQEIADAYRWRRTANVPTVPPQDAIDPFEALWRLRLTESEINLLYPYFRHGWTLRPEDKVSKSRVRVFPTTRYCLCVLINDALAESGWIREYQLTDEEWGDVERIKWRVTNRSTQDWN